MQRTRSGVSFHHSQAGQTVVRSVDAAGPVAIDRHIREQRRLSRGSLDSRLFAAALVQKDSRPAAYGPRCPWRIAMPPFVRTLCLTVAVFALFSGCGPKEDPAPPPTSVATPPPTETVKLGFAAPLTGAQAHYGADMRNGLTLAVEEANASRPHAGWRARAVRAARGRRPGRPRQGHRRRAEAGGRRDQGDARSLQLRDEHSRFPNLRRELASRRSPWPQRRRTPQAASPPPFA
jgi:hypothetical protein